MTNPMQEAQQLGQSIWYDNISRGMLASGEMQRLIDLGITGVTSNPTIFEKAIAGGNDYDDALALLSGTDRGVSAIYEALAVEDIKAAADLLRPVYDRTDGADGYVSLEVSPTLAHDTMGTVAEARRLFTELDRPNVMIKVPATPAGADAVQVLISNGINVNVTLIFSIGAYEAVMEAYVAGLEARAGRGEDVSKVASVASFFVSRIDTLVDSFLEQQIQMGRQEVKGLKGRAAVANAIVAYQHFKAIFEDERFKALKAKGARVQRPLWASTSTKNPEYPDLLYVEPLVGPNTVNTMPPVTVAALLDHGKLEATIDDEVDGAMDCLDELAGAGVGMDEVTQKLLEDGVASFAESYKNMLANIEEKRRSLAQGG